MSDTEQYDATNDTLNDTMNDSVEDAELEAIKARVKEMEEEAEKLKELQAETEKTMGMQSTSPTAAAFPTPEEKEEADRRSVYVGNVDYSSTAKELEQHFRGCGTINRVTILCDKFTGNPKGFAYIEFADDTSVEAAVALHESLFKGRQIKVSVKRTNQPGMNRGRGRGRGYGRGGMGFMGPGGMMYVPMPMSGFGSGYGGSSYRGNSRGRSRGSARGTNYYSPY